MKLILLAGNNKQSNQDWIQEIEQKLGVFFDETYIQYYSHRHENKPNMDLEHESKIFLEKINQDGDYVIFAKSAGTVLAMKNIFENGLEPRACIFVGVPMGMIFNNEFPYQNWLKNIKCPILFIQKTDDPVCSYQKLVDLFCGFSDRFIFQEVDGNTHHYEDVELLKKLIGEFIMKI